MIPMLVLLTALPWQEPPPPPTAPPATAAPAVAAEEEPPLPTEFRPVDTSDAIPGTVTMPLTLQQAIYMAEKNSLPLRIDELDVQIALGQLGAAIGQFDTVAFLEGAYQKNINPSASQLEGGFGNIAVVGVLQETYTLGGGFRGPLLTGGSYQADIQWSESFRDPAPFSLFNPTYQSSIGLSVAQPLLRGFGTTIARQDILRANNELEASAETLEASRLLRAREVIGAYWNHYFARRTLETREFLVSQAERLLRINLKKEEVGEAIRLDVIEAEAELAQRRQELIIARNDIGRTADQLKRLIFSFEERAEWDVELVPVTEAAAGGVDVPSWEDAARVALERRPELRTRRALLKNNDLSILVAENQLLPRFDLNGTLRFNQLAASKGQVLNYDDDLYSLGAGFVLEVPLANRTARYGLSVARLRKIQALVDYKDAENQVIQEVRDAVRDLLDSKEAIDAAREAVRLAAERWTAEQRRLEVGFSTTFQVRDAQALWREAVDAETRALFDYQIALAGIRAAQGTLLESYGILPAPKPRLEDHAAIHYDQDA